MFGTFCSFLYIFSKNSMFAYLSKKISIPNNSRVEAVSWSVSQGWVAVGGETQDANGRKGLLKIFKLDEQKGGLAGSQGQLQLNINLENHQSAVKVVIWNELYQKLTTADESGLIIVWMLHKNQWFEEMINNRNKSFVSDMKWSPDGTRICIIYDDGAVIVGSVDGNRLWGREYKYRLSLVEWSPDSKLLILGTPDGQVLVHDQMGGLLHGLKLQCLQRLVDPSRYSQPGLPLASIAWFENSKMYTDDTPPGLLIAYQNGRVQLMRHDKDEQPILIDTVMRITQCRWIADGSIFAISGSIQEGKDFRGVVQFYTNQGNHLKTLRVPNSEVIKSFDFEGSGLRLVLGTEGLLYFANMKMDYKWCYIPQSSTLVFAFQRSDRVEYTVVFWDIKREVKTIRYVRGLVAIKGTQDLCTLISKTEETQAVNGEQTTFLDTWKLELCNPIGSPLDTKNICIEPMYQSMTKTHIVLANNDYVYVWQYRNQVAKLTSFESNAQQGIRKLGREIAWYIDDNPDANLLYDKEAFNMEKQTEDIISAVTANENFLFVGRISGTILKFTLPHVSIEPKLFLQTRPNIMAINSNSSRLSVIDLNGTLTILECNTQGGQALDFEKKDCWALVWSDNDPLQFAVMEKSRMHIVRDVTADEPITTEAFICGFSDLKVRGALLDDIMRSPDGQLKVSELVVDFESRQMKEIKELMKKQSARELYAMVEKQPSEALWRALALKALDDFDFSTAERAFLKVEDYAGLQMMKRICNFDDKEKQRAEVLAFQGMYDEAEEILRKIERKDLAIQLRMKLGDYNRVLQLTKDNAGYDQVILKVNVEVGNQYAEQQRWDKAIQHYKMANHYEGLIEAYTRVEDYDSLDKLANDLPEGSPLLNELGEKFQLMGLAKSAIKCFEKIGDVKKAIDCAVLLNAWNFAIELAERYNFMQIQTVLSQYAAQLLDSKRKLEAAELYRKANHNTEAARILSQIANDLVERESNPLQVKKLYVMAALEVDIYKKRLYDATMTAQNTTTAKTLDSLITSDINTSADKILNNPWRGAEAWHFFILTQRFLYQGHFLYALKAAIRLTEFQLEMDPKKIYSLVAIAAYYAHYYKECSRAFVKLESLPNLTDEERERYQAVAVSIFIKHPPQDPQGDLFPCPGKNCKAKVTELQTHCKSCGVNFGACVASGRAILFKEYYQCKACKHKMIESEVQRLSLRFCALCHTPVDFKRFGQREQE